MDIYKQSIDQFSKLLSNKEISALELLEIFLSRIKKHNKTLNAFITVDGDFARQQAIKADELISKGKSNILTGIPIAHKDLFCTKMLKTTCGSKMLDNFTPPYNATVVENLNNKGMVLVGKTNMDEFAMGSSSETSFYGPVCNPWNHKKVSGGSSGGSASAVASRIIPIATGSDTGGSIRQPSSFCGLTGLKPTYGSVSRYGMIAYASSLDQGGPIAKTARDCAILYSAMRGYDSKDSTSNKSLINFKSDLSCKDAMTIGIPTEYFDDKLDSDVKDVLDDAINQFKKLKFKIKEISLPKHKFSIPAYYIIASSEASSNLSRYDGVKFGYRCDNPDSMKDLYERTRQEGFGHEVKKRIMLGTYSLSSGYYDEYYIRAQKIRRLIYSDFDEAFKSVDIILTPTSPSIAFDIGEKSKDALQMYLSDIYTTPVNLAGLPALSIPVGFSKEMPVGLQIIGKHYSESQILGVANLYQEETNWHNEMPEGY